MSSKETINAAIVGYGFGTRTFHIPLIENEKKINLYGIVSSSDHKRVEIKNMGYEAFLSVEEAILDNNVDLIVIVTPHHTHKELAVKALNAGKHVVTDKIMCLSVNEADEMIEAAKSNNKMLSVFQNRRWDGDYLTINNCVNNGMLGSVYEMKAYVKRNSKRAHQWRTKKQFGGGTFMDWGAHLIDQALQLNKLKVTSVYCEKYYMNSEIDVETNVRLRIEFEDDSRYIIELDSNSHIVEKGYRICGTQAELISYGYDPQEELLKGGVVNSNAPMPKDNLVELYQDGKRINIPLYISGCYTQYYKNIAEHLLEGVELAVKPEECRRALKLYEAAFKSIEEKCVVEVDF